MAATPASMSFCNSLSSAGLRRDGKRSVRDLRTHRVGVRCQQSGGSDGGEQKNNNVSLNMDRRDMLLALGGLSGLGAGSMALANPVAVPNLTKCKPAHDEDIEAGSDYLKCCPPFDPLTKPTPWTPTPSAVTRVRRPAHEAVKDKDYVKKYKEGIRKMKFDLDQKSDPRNFWNQAKVHCAFCNGAYNNGVFDLQVHHNWLFLPWHRYYVHFFERILCKVLNDDTFALPFWNFDQADGMTFPAIFTDPNSVLYDGTRNMDHARDSSVVMDLEYSLFAEKQSSGFTGQKLIDNNLDKMKTTMQNSVGKLETFLGRPVRAGELSTEASGSLESLHNVMHMWTGPTTSPYVDMGNFVTAARDCVFYCLHSEVDRLWEVYRNLSEADGYKKDFDDRDWLEASFVFCDENKQIVKVQTKDCLDTMNLGYTYQEVPLPWYTRPSLAAAKATARSVKPSNLIPVSPFGSSPRELKKPIRALVTRPKANRSDQEKKDAMEVVAIKGIQPEAGPIRFNVYISNPVGDQASSDDYGAYVGSFTKLTSQHAMTQKMEMDLGITRTIDDMIANDAQKLVVTLVPSGGNVTIGGVEINLLKTDKI